MIPINSKIQKYAREAVNLKKWLAVGLYFEQMESPFLNFSIDVIGEMADFFYFVNILVNDCDGCFLLKNYEIFQIPTILIFDPELFCLTFQFPYVIETNLKHTLLSFLNHNKKYGYPKTIPKTPPMTFADESLPNSPFSPSTLKKNMVEINIQSDFLNPDKKIVEILKTDKFRKAIEFFVLNENLIIDSQFSYFIGKKQINIDWTPIDIGLDKKELITINVRKSNAEGKNGKKRRISISFILASNAAEKYDKVIEYNGKFGKIISSIQKRFNLRVDSYTFYCKGVCLKENDTPKSLKIQSGDIIIIREKHNLGLEQNKSDTIEQIDNNSEKNRNEENNSVVGNHKNSNNSKCLLI
ncbi:hypothetical protein TRFO_20115 [Tritrichomonas foetus]|uniref:Uncharacterized protein n=1 Tax=Tritrichomonas foetus TaxID=1144522 RepID=A0A1J4KHL3_9EUKA|nr:hypothetical protein TRFO_20115 [Tritrichomonas foetus]|eukprot:OHT10530.1 hypothetical protein TRFO_20115 [Tritrichomonas foetus]